MITRIWHSVLGMEQKDEAWFRKHIRQELIELMEAQTVMEKWSELADVVYAVTRAKWNKHERIQFPLTKRAYAVGWVYMIPKHTSRWLFYRVAGGRVRRGVRMKVVRNPLRTEKLHAVAQKYEVDPARFEHVCKQQLRWWPLLK